MLTKFQQWFFDRRSAVVSRIESKVRRWEQQPLKNRKRQVLLLTVISCLAVGLKFAVELRFPPAPLPRLQNGAGWNIHRQQSFDSVARHRKRRIDSLTRQMYLAELTRLKLNANPKSRKGTPDSLWNRTKRNR